MTGLRIDISLSRYDGSTNRSLKPFSAADEYLVEAYQEKGVLSEKTVLYNDQFGFLACHLQEAKPTIVLTSKSQQLAIEANLRANKLPAGKFAYPLTALKNPVSCALIKAPKSLALFELFLQHLAQHSTADVTVFVGFMTRHFSKKMIDIAATYFNHVEQSRAKKKARVMTLQSKKAIPSVDIIDRIHYNGEEYKQYWGVFSRKHIDYATQFLIDFMEVRHSDSTILDLASGNGVIAKEILKQAPGASVHLLDDSYLAVESGKLNVTGQHVYHHYANDLSEFKDETFDLIVTNPPFHVEHEINIEVSLHLFKACYRCLKPGGSLQLVANQHLNYKTHLKPIFSRVEVMAENEKFVVYRCPKGRAR